MKKWQNRQIFWKKIEKTGKTIQMQSAMVRKKVPEIRNFHVETRMLFWEKLLVLQVLHKIWEKWES